MVPGQTVGNNRSENQFLKKIQKSRISMGDFGKIVEVIQDMRSKITATLRKKVQK